MHGGAHRGVWSSKREKKGGDQVAAQTTSRGDMHSDGQPRHGSFIIPLVVESVASAFDVDYVMQWRHLHIVTCVTNALGDKTEGPLPVACNVLCCFVCCFARHMTRVTQANSSHTPTRSKTSSIQQQQQHRFFIHFRPNALQRISVLLVCQSAPPSRLRGRPLLPLTGGVMTPRTASTTYPRSRSPAYVALPI